MLRIILIGAVVIGTAAAQSSIPKGATEVEPGVFKHKDASGKSYTYRKTPFGVVKSDDSASKAREEAAAAAVKTESKVAPSSEGQTSTPFGDIKNETKAQVKVTEKGDSLEFERTSPFGSYRWKNKKDQLTAEEREAWDRSRGQAGAPAATGSQE